jgi:hypothetical protein
MLYNKKVSISESALLVIDAQDSFKVGARWERRNNRAFEKTSAGWSSSIVNITCQSSIFCIPTMIRDLNVTAPTTR